VVEHQRPPADDTSKIAELEVSEFHKLLLMEPGGEWECTREAFDMTLRFYLDETLSDAELDALHASSATREELCIYRTHQALRSFILQHKNRARSSWERHKDPPTLAHELGPAWEFMNREFGTDSSTGVRVRELIDDYSAQIIGQIHDEGFRAENADSVPAMWVLHDAMLSSIEPHAYYLIAAIADVRETR